MATMDARVEALGYRLFDAEATMLFPTLGVSIEQLIADDVDATYMNKPT